MKLTLLRWYREGRGELIPSVKDGGRESQVPIKVFPADWNTHGRGAGPIRNRQMAAYADALIAIWDGKSRGTKHMIDEAKKYGLYVIVWVQDGEDWKPEITKGVK